MTPVGFEKLKLEIHRLKTIERPRVIRAIAEARAHGDLKENAEYHAAKEEQGLLEARIADMEQILALAHVIDYKTLQANGSISFGDTITLFDLQTDSQKKYQIVGKLESDIKSGKLPVSSPIARALIGKKLGEIVTIQVPKGLQEYEILKIEYI